MHQEQPISEDLSALWGWTQTASTEVIPYEERCWRCDVRRSHEGCAAGLCDECCRDLRSETAA